MNRSERWLWGSAGVALTIAILLALHAGATLRSSAAQLQQTDSDLRSVIRWQEKIAPLEAAARGFNDLKEARPEDPAAILRSAWPAAPTPEIQEKKRDLDGRWLIREKEFVFKEVPVADIMRFAFAMETASRTPAGFHRPPWRLQKCEVRASSQAKGVAQLAVLKFEAMERK